MVAGIQTHGQLSEWHPHIHALTTHGEFTPDGTFIPLPDDLCTTPFLKIWEDMVRCPFSRDCIISVSDNGQVVYRADKAECQPFHIRGDEKLFRGISRNFEGFAPLEFPAGITQHIPDPGMRMIRYDEGIRTRSRAA